MKSYLTFLVLSLISHNKAINYPGFKVFKPKHDHGNGEMDWEGLSDMIDDMEAVKGWYEETFESGMDEELLKANLIFFMKVPANVTGFSENDGKLVQKIASDKMKKIKKEDLAQGKKKRKMGDQVPHPEVESLKALFNSEEMDWGAVNADDILKVKKWYDQLILEGDEEITNMKLVLTLKRPTEYIMKAFGLSLHDAQLIQNIAFDEMKKIRDYEEYEEYLRMKEKQKKIEKMTNQENLDFEEPNFEQDYPDYFNPPSLPNTEDPRNQNAHQWRRG